MGWQAAEKQREEAERKVQEMEGRLADSIAALQAGHKSQEDVALLQAQVPLTTRPPRRPPDTPPQRHMHFLTHPRAHVPTCACWENVRKIR